LYVGKHVKWNDNLGGRLLARLVVFHGLIETLGPDEQAKVTGLKVKLPDLVAQRLAQHAAESLRQQPGDLDQMGSPLSKEMDGSRPAAVQNRTAQSTAQAARA